MKRRNFLLTAGACGTSFAISGGALGASSARVLRFGQSAALTGSQAVYGTDVRNGIAAAFAAANATEATTGVRFELVTVDDAGVKGKCVSNATQLIESGVSALIGLTNGVAAEACVPMVDQVQAALLGTASGN